MYDCEMDGNSCNFCFHNGYCKYDGPSDNLFDELAKIVYSCKEDCSECPDYDGCIRDEKLQGSDLIDPCEVIKNYDVAYIGMTSILSERRMIFYDCNKERLPIESRDGEVFFEVTVEQWEINRVKDLLNIEYNECLFDCVLYPVKGGE